LERAVQRTEAIRRSQMKVIEHQPSEAKQNGDAGLSERPKTDLTLAPQIPDRRFRRRA
jgi:hypothetical protein